jgi:Prokaryotic RING finger family 1
MDWVAVGVLSFYGLLMMSFVSYSIYSERRLTKKIALVLEELGLSSIKRGISKVKGLWNGMEATFYVHGSNRISRRRTPEKLVAELKTDIKSRFYLQNRSLPPLTRSVEWDLKNCFSPPSIDLQNEDDRGIFAAYGKSPDLIQKLLDSPASRVLIIKNLIDADGEVFLEGGRLSVMRTTRARFSSKNPASYELLEKLLREEWDLLRTAANVLLPLELDVSERHALSLFCPFCRSELTDVVSVTRCSECSTLHHTACWNENGRCSIFGCKGQSTSYLKQGPATIRTR